MHRDIWLKIQIPFNHQEQQNVTKHQTKYQYEIMLTGLSSCRSSKFNHRQCLKMDETSQHISSTFAEIKVKTKISLKIHVSQIGSYFQINPYLLSSFQNEEFKTTCFLGQHWCWHLHHPTDSRHLLNHRNWNSQDTERSLMF